MDLRHQSSAMCVIMLGGEDSHPWSAKKGSEINDEGLLILLMPANIPVDHENKNNTKKVTTQKLIT